MQHIATIDWAICIGYLGLVVGLGFFFANKQKDNDDFFLGGRKMPWLPVGLSLFATTFSSNSFVGLPAEGAYRNYHQLLAIFFIPFVVVPITCIWFIPFYKSWGFTSLYEYLERRFNRPVRLLASIIFMMYSAGWMATMLLAVSRILNVVMEGQINAWARGIAQFADQSLNIALTDAAAQQAVIMFLIGAVGLFATIYTAAGGVKAVIWTDTLQAFALGGGMFFLLFILLGEIDGGWSALVSEGAAAGKFEMFRTDGGLAERNMFSACAYGFFVYLGSQLANYGAFQRYITVDTVSDARKSLIVKGVFTLIVCGLFFLVGTALFVFYQQYHPEIFRDFSEGGGKDKLLPHFVVNFAGGFGITGLLLAGLFAAAMSSLDSGINSMTASFVTDWLRGREIGTTRNRLITFVFGGAVTLVACLLSLINSPVFDILLAIAGATLGLLLTVMMLGMLVPRANTAGALIGVATGLLVFIFIRLVIPNLTVDQLDQLGPLAGLKKNTWWDGLFTAVPAVVVGILASFFTARPRPEQLEGLLLIRFSSKPKS